MNNYCGAMCEGCKSENICKGCINTCGSPFGGRCVAAEYIKVGGLAAYEEFKKKIKGEINKLLISEGIPAADDLCELVGEYVNLEFQLPNGEKVKLLNDKDIYLCTQIEIPDKGSCIGIAADTSFILICSYGEGGENPEIVMYKRR